MNESPPARDTGAGSAFLRELCPGSFIYEMAGALSTSRCAAMVARFEASVGQQVEGRVGPHQALATDVKRSTDLRVSGRDDWKDVDGWLFESLTAGLTAMVREHPFFAANAFRDMGYHLQRTRPGEYYHWHVDSGPGVLSQRQLVAIWYLNELAAGGETEFHFQQVRVRPECGKLLLFPPFWTHVHRGVEVTGGVKYIATTWVCFQ